MLNFSKSIISLILVVIITILQIGISEFRVFASTYSDVPSNYWAYSAIEALSAKSILQPVTDGMFKPEQSITRADFVTMLNNIMEVTIKEKNRYLDIPSDAYYTQAVINMTAAGIVQGVENKRFFPSGLLTREQAASIAVRAFEYKKGSDLIALSKLDNYSDATQISDWAIEYVNKALACGIMKGVSEKEFNPQINITKSESAVLILNLLLAFKEQGSLNIKGSSQKTEIEQVKRGNIFFDDESVDFKLHTGCDIVEVAIYDYWGQKVENWTETITEAVQKLTVSLEQKGYFELVVYGNNAENKRTELIRTPFAIISRYDFNSITDSDFGVCAHLRWDFNGWQRDLVNEISWMGAKNIRDDFGWANTEKTKGVYSISPSPQREMMISNNMSFMLAAGYENPLYDGGATPYTEDGRTGFANYVNGTIDAYGSNLKYVDIFNEFWGAVFGDRGNGPADAKAEYYYPLLKKTYEEIKKKHPEVIALSNTVTDNKPGWYESLLKLGAAKYMDAAFLHSYFNGETPEYGLSFDFDLVNKLHEKYTPDKEIPIYITETGATTADNAKTEREQAQYIIRTYAIAKGYGAKKVYWYDFMDDGINPDEREHLYGLIRNPKSSLGAFTPKPSYVSYAAMTRELTGKTLTSHEISDDGIYKYVFENKKEKINVMWALENKDIIIKTNTPLQITDLMGNQKTYYPKSGEIYLTLSEDALYIKGNFQSYNVGTSISMIAKDIAVNTKINVDWKIEPSILYSENFNISIDNKDVTFVKDNSNGQIKSILQPAKTEGVKEIMANIMIGNQLVGCLKRKINITKPYSADIKSSFKKYENKEGVLDIEFTNNTPEEIAIDCIDLELGDKSSKYDVNVNLQPQSKEKINLKLIDVDIYKVVDTTLKFNIDGVADRYVYKSSVEFNPIINNSITVDGILDANTEKIPSIDLSTGKWINLTNEKYMGNSDLSGNIWLTWDDKSLYLTAKIIDDIHLAPNTNGDIWKNDVLQFALYAPNVNGFTPYDYFEYGISLANKPEVYRWKTTNGLSVGSVENVKVAVTRNEVNKNTVYEIGIPWSEIAPLDPTKQENCMFSVLVSDNDIKDRKGWLEWGSGIGKAKKVDMFRNFYFVEK